MALKTTVRIGFLAGLIGVAWFVAWLVPRVSFVPRTSGEFSQQIYVWNRAWTGPVQDSIALRVTNFSRLVALVAEVNWKNRQPRVVHVDLDYPTLTNSACPVGLALRIGSYPGPFGTEDDATRMLGELSETLLQTARSNGLSVAEFQIDFDCAESKLPGYQVWVEAIRRRVAPVPVTITALPSWVKRRAFRSLVRATDGYVLQVHSLEPPRSVDQVFTLCDPAAARRVVERAAKVGVPFQVALPTYGYEVGFDSSGRFVGISAEGPSPNWPADGVVKEVSADADAMARLVRAWTRDRPASLQGVIWYRMPVAGDRLNWKWPTLSAVMEGRNPVARLSVRVRNPKAALSEIDLLNVGDGDYRRRVTIRTRWSDSRLVACDGLRDFEVLVEGETNINFISRLAVHLPPQSSRMVGWIRLDKETDVHAEISSK